MPTTATTVTPPVTGWPRPLRWTVALFHAVNATGVFAGRRPMRAFRNTGGLDLNARQLHVYRDPAPLPMPPDRGAVAYSTHLTLGPNDTVSPLAAPNSPVRVADLLP